MYQVKKLSRMPYANARVIITDDGITLRSYSTNVVHIDTNNWLTCNGLYSNTTRRHISAFMNEYTNDSYFLAKKCYLEDLKYNLLTGEAKAL